MRFYKLVMLLGVLAGSVLFAAGSTATADHVMNLFRIGTGGTGATYYPVGQAIAKIISNPTSATECDPACGVPGLLAVVQTANGSVSNVEDIQKHKIESGFSQSDVAYWAATATGVYEGQARNETLRGIASLYREDVHIVARKDARITRVEDLRGKRVSLDDPGSGTLVGARIILDAFGLTEDDMQTQYIKAAEAVEKIRDGKLDAFFIITGSPLEAIVELSDAGLVTLVPITGPAASRLTWENPFFSPTTIPAGTYTGIDTVRTLGVAALWIVSSQQPEEQVYQVTRTFWENLPALKKLGLHPKIDKISLANAFASMSVPLHPGALRYYQEAGLVIYPEKF